MKLNALKFGLAGGIVCAAYLIVLGILARFLCWGVDMVNTLGSMYYGYGPSVKRALIGGVWGFADGFIFLGIFALVYNFLLGQKE